MRTAISTLTLPRTALALIAALILSTAATEASADDYQLDPGHTAVVFRIGHLNMSHIYGRFNDVQGSFKLGASPSDFVVTIKAESIDTGLKKRDEHLRSPDFFNTRQFPVITFKSTKIAAGADGYSVTGNLSLHGQTKPVTFALRKLGEGQDPWGNYRAGFSAELSIKRSDFGMTNMPEAVGDQVDLFISFEGLRQ